MAQITKYNTTFVEDYRSHRIEDVFVHTDSPRNLERIGDFCSVHKMSDIVRFIEETENTLLISVERLEHEELIQMLQTLAEKKAVQVFLLLGNPQTNLRCRDVLANRCLIRTGVPQEGMFVMRDHGTLKAQGKMILSSQFASSLDCSSLVMHLDPKQQEDAFRSFCKLFWEKATDEYISGTSAGKISKNPEGEILLNASHHMPKSLKEHLDDIMREGVLACIQNNTIPCPNGNADMDMLFDVKYSPDNIKKSVSQGVTVGLIECIAPNVLLSTRNGLVLPDTVNFDKSNWCVFLSSHQQQVLGDALRNLCEFPQWKFHKTIEQAKVAHLQKVRYLSDIAVTYECLSERKKVLDDIYTKSIDDFYNSKQEVRKFIPKALEWQRSSMSHTIEYSVTVHPFYKPQEAKQASLYAQWDETQNSWNNALAKLTDSLGKITTHTQGVVQSILERLSRFFMVQERQIVDISSSIEGLRGWNVRFQSPADRVEKNQQLLSLFTDIEELHQKCKKNIDETKKKTEWERTQTELQEKIAILKKQYTTQSNELLVQEDSIKQEISRLTTVEFVHKWSTEMENEKNNIKMDELDFESAKRWEHGLSDKKRKEYKVFSSIVKEIEHSCRALNIKLDTAKKDVEKIKKTVEYTEQQLVHHGDVFVYVPSKGENELDAQLGNKKKTEQWQEIQWPTEELPKDFALWEHKNIRYLTISDDAQLAQATMEATRLQALLCVEKYQN